MAASKFVPAASQFAAAAVSLTFRRTLTCAAGGGGSAYPRSSRFDPDSPDLVEWVRSEGGFVHPAVNITHDDTTGLGLVASQPLPKGSRLISLPDHFPLKFDATSVVHAASVLADLARKIPEDLWAMKLGLKLIQELSRRESFWGPYIGNLPTEFTNPIFFPAEDNADLQYRVFLDQVFKRQDFLFEFEELVKQTLATVKPSDHPFFGKSVDVSWLASAMCAVSSRAFCLRGHQTDVHVLLPLIDMCNHSFKPNVRIVQEQGSQDQSVLIEAVAATAIEEDEPLLINYGGLSNDRFFLDYGFVVPSNPYDYVEIKFDATLLDLASVHAGVSSPNFSSPAPWQKDILSQLNLHGDAPNLKVKLGGKELVDGRLLAGLRVMLTSERQLVEKHDLSSLKSLSCEAPLGIANEVTVLRTLLALVVALSNWPTEMAEDESLIKKGGMPVTTELVIRYRLQKKYMVADVKRDLMRRLGLLVAKEMGLSDDKDCIIVYA